MDTDRDTAEDAAIAHFRERDHRLAPTSETSLLGDCLYDIRHVTPLDETVLWWDAVYDDYDRLADAEDTEGINDLCEQIHNGNYEPTR